MTHDAAYVIVTDGDTSELEKRVSNYLSAGYQLAGGISVATSTSLGGTIYAQALVYFGSNKA